MYALHQSALEEPPQPQPQRGLFRTTTPTTRYARTQELPPPFALDKQRALLNEERKRLQALRAFVLEQRAVFAALARTQ